MESLFDEDGEEEEEEEGDDVLFGGDGGFPSTPQTQGFGGGQNMLAQQMVRRTLLILKTYFKT